MDEKAFEKAYKRHKRFANLIIVKTADSTFFTDSYEIGKPYAETAMFYYKGVELGYCDVRSINEVY